MPKNPRPDRGYPGLFLGKGRLVACCFALPGFKGWHSLSLSSAGATYHRDLRTSDLSDLPFFETIVFACAPSERSEDAFQGVYNRALGNVLANCRYNRVVYCGSTGVYAEDFGGEVEENSLLDRESFRGSILIQAEDLVRQYAPENHIILRLTGLCDSVEKLSLFSHANHWFNRLTRQCAAQWVEKAVLYAGSIAATVNINEYTGCDREGGAPVTGKRIISAASRQLFGSL